MNITTFINNFLTISNAYDTEKYVAQWHKNAVLDDPSVGKIFRKHAGIKAYFQDYFIGYQTQTRLVKLDIISEHEAHIEVDFTGNFPGGQTGGKFDLTFKDGKIIKAIAELL